jgi:Holliday junction resolvase RusA-like endonuclease
MRTEFWIAGVPMPQPRVKSRVLPPDSYGQVRSTVYTPEAKIKPWKSLIALQARMHKPIGTLVGPVRVILAFFIPRPKYLCRPRSPQGPMRCFKRGTGDGDNYAKALLDVLQEIGWYEDDSQVADLRVQKFYHAIGGSPGVAVGIEALSEAVSADVEAGGQRSLICLTTENQTDTPE